MIHTAIRRPRFHPVYALSVLFAVVLLSSPGAGQSIPEPPREKLLNGLTVLFWQRAGDPNVLLKLRVKSGAAFDFAGKGGAMALLGDALFPDPATREYVTDQLGGRLDVTTDHDAIEVTISGKASELERLVDLLRTALVTTQLTTENVARVRDARLKTLAAKPLTPSEIADQEIAVRLLGKFPYGHPASGTVETVAKLDRADLLLARERFLNPDNAALVVIGGVDKGRAMRALRQLLGLWSKSDRTVPATFRQPDPPDARVLVVNQPDASSAQLRLAVRGLSLSDPGATAATLLARIVRDRWQSASPDLNASFARHEAHALPGIFVMGASAPTSSAAKAVSAAQQVLRSLAASAPPTLAEFERARDAELAEISRQSSQMELTDATAESWLRLDAFNLLPPASYIGKLTPADLQRVAVRLFKDTPVATVAVGNYEQLKAGFDRGVELRGEKPNAKSASEPITPAKKP